MEMAEQSRGIADELAARAAALNAALTGFRLGAESDAAVREAAALGAIGAARRAPSASPAATASAGARAEQDTVEFF